MDIEKWSDIISSPTRVLSTAYKRRHDIQKWWKWIQAHYNIGQSNIVVLGRPNVGKSVMMAYLYGESNSLSWELPETSTKIETTALTLEDWTKLIRVVPGQTGKQRNRTLNETFNKQKSLEGIVYVVDWGFTNERNAVVKKQMIEGNDEIDKENVDEKIDSIAKLRALYLSRELDDFKSTCDLIERAFAGGNAPKWLLIVTNKADLFFDKLDEAQQYYHPNGGSEFSKILQTTLSEVGKQNLKCDAIPLCSYERDFDWNNEIIESKIGGEENRKTFAKNFFKTIANF